MLPENPTLEQLEAEFNNDKFATHAAHCKIVEGNKGHSVCEMPIEDIHRNAMGNVMGGQFLPWLISLLLSPEMSVNLPRFQLPIR